MYPHQIIIDIDIDIDILNLSLRVWTGLPKPFMRPIARRHLMRVLKCMVKGGMLEGLTHLAVSELWQEGKIRMYADMTLWRGHKWAPDFLVITNSYQDVGIECKNYNTFWMSQARKLTNRYRATLSPCQVKWYSSTYCTHPL